MTLPPGKTRGQLSHRTTRCHQTGLCCVLPNQCKTSTILLPSAVVLYRKGLCPFQNHPALPFLYPGKGHLHLYFIPTPSDQVRNLAVGPLFLFSYPPKDPVLPLYLYFQFKSRAVPPVPVTLPCTWLLTADFLWASLPLLWVPHSLLHPLVREIFKTWKMNVLPWILQGIFLIQRGKVGSRFVSWAPAVSTLSWEHQLGLGSNSCGAVE